jgi:hypothetical protein
MVQYQSRNIIQVEEEQEEAKPRQTSQTGSRPGPNERKLEEHRLWLDALGISYSHEDINLVKQRAEG